MRLRQLQLLKYGAIEDCVLDFPAGDSDLHLVVGPNEAGKSTTLAAVSDLLFGFPHRTPFDFRFDRQQLRVGAIVEDGGAPLELIRRKRNAETLLGPDETPLGDGALAPMLGGQSRESFERMFGLDHTRLRAGGKAMLDAKDDAGQAIFAAGSGLLDISRVCEALEDEAREIWTNRAVGARRYHVAAAASQVARTRLRESLVRASKWTEYRRALEGAEAQLEALRRERAEVAQQHRTVEWKRRVLVCAAHRALILAQADAYAGALTVGVEDEARIDAAIEARAHAMSELAALERQLTVLNTQASEGAPSAEALALRDEVEALRDSRSAIENGRQMRPGLQAELVASRRRLLDLAAEIGWAEVEPAALKAKLLGRPALAELGDLIAKRSGIDEQLRAARDTLADTQAATRRCQAEADAFPTPPDVRTLQDLVRTLRGRALPEATRRMAKDLAQLDEVLRAKLQALSPWRGDAAALRALSLPADEDLNHAVERIEALEAKLEEATSEGARDNEQVQRLQLDRRQRSLEHPAPSLDVLLDARRARGAAWTPLRDHIIGGPKVTAPEAAIEAFEAQVSATDELADTRFAAAEHAGGLAALEREIEQAELRRAQDETRRRSAETELAAAEREFDDLVAGIAPGLTPKSVHGWRDAVAEALDVAIGRDAAALGYDGALRDEAEARAALFAVFGAAATDAALEALLAEGERRIETASAARAELATLETRLENAVAAEAKAVLRAAEAERLDAEWLAAWTPALARAALPQDAGVAGARARLQLMEELRADIDAVVTLGEQIAEIDLRASAFEDRISATAAQLELTGTPTELIGKLQAAVQAAVKMEERQAEIAERLESLETDRASALSCRDEAEATLSALLAVAPSGDAAALRGLLRDGREARRLHDDLRKTESEIVSHGEGRALEVLLGEVEGADPAGLAAEAQALADRLEDLNGRVEAQSAARQAAEAAFIAIDDGPAAAEAAADVALARSEMAEQADLYMRKRAEIRLLRAGMERFRKQKQGPLLARASELFATLTLGAFSELIVELEGDIPKLIGLRADGATATPVGGMSEGTVDQLFLALRIAAVEDVVAQGARLPFLADDLFVNFDDERAAAGFRILAELATKTQVLFFSHHPHLVAVAGDALRPAQVSLCNLERRSGALQIAVAAA